MLRTFPDRYYSEIEMMACRTSRDGYESEKKKKRNKEKRKTRSLSKLFHVKRHKSSYIRQNKMLFNLGFVRWMKILNIATDVWFGVLVLLSVVPVSAKLTSPGNILK